MIGLMWYDWTRPNGNPDRRYFPKSNVEEIAAHGKSRNWFMGGRAKTAHVVGTPQYRSLNDFLNHGDQQTCMKRISIVCVAPPGLVAISTVSQRLRAGLSNSAPLPPHYVQNQKSHVLGTPDSGLELIISSRRPRFL